MIVVEGIEKALVGWFQREGKVGPVYSADRIRILMEEDGIDVQGQDEILFALTQQCDMTQGDDEDLPPIIVHSCDYEELKWRDSTGNFNT